MGNETGVKDYCIIHWRPVSERPEEASYVLIKCNDEIGPACYETAYEDGRFIDTNTNEGCGCKPIDEGQILGWSYFPCDRRD